MSNPHTNFSLGDYFPPLERRLSRALISERQLIRIRDYANQVPGQVSAFFGFECHLGIGEASADLLFCSTQLEGHSKVLAGQHKKVALPDAFFELPAWRKVQEFCVKWEDPASSIHQKLFNIWLEFDIAKSEPPYSPSIFFGTQPPESLTSRDEGHLVILEALEQLVPEALEGTRAMTLNSVLKHLPDSAYIFQVGAMLARNVPAIRICLRDLPPVDIVPTLSNMGWNGSSVELEELVRELAPISDRIDVDLDVGETIGTKIGLECSFGKDESSFRRMGTFTNYMVDKELTNREKAQALMDFNGLVHQDSAPDKWSPHLLNMAAISGPGVANHISCWLHHVKLVFEADTPLSAKAYLAVAPDRMQRAVLLDRVSRFAD